MKRKSWVWPMVAFAGVALIGGTVFAQNRPRTQHKEVAKAMDENSMTLAKAIDAAEKEAKGKAISARAEMDDGKLDFSIQVSAGEDLKFVKVDAKGKATVGPPPRRGDRGGRGEDGEKPEPTKPAEPPKQP